MIELLERFDLGGDDYKIWRLTSPMRPEEGTRFLDFCLATMQSYPSRRNLSYWRLYYQHAFDGENAPEIEDVFYFAEVNGEVAARLWFGYAPANGFGNFGNALTAEKFRRRGLLRRMMVPCVRGFHASTAKCLACDTGKEYAAATYMDYGFKMIYGGAVGPMAIVSKEYPDFAALEARYLGDARPVRFRPGVVGDQFMIDKFLHYCARVYPNSPRIDLDYRCCMLECRAGNGHIMVAVNAADTAVGFAWAGKFDGLDRLYMSIHPEAAPYCGEMLKELREVHGGIPLCHLQFPKGALHTPALEGAGARRLCTLAGGATVWEL